ncbi:Avirulence (Avh) protein [Phytophthora megakarya]|uniref:RxLR effector protein n=1 Tax=Phytophthora megakarya TaxID=4795 RepID=A0A225VJX6_9STRA|nr:Avirulence (Avh) protein [Phytophthora megakarya]
MGLYLTVVVVVVAHLVNVGTLSTGVLAQLTPNPHHLTHSIVSGTDIIEQRSLRVNERDEGRSDSEERAGTLISKVSNYFKDNNVIRWADKHKSDDFVKGKLKLNGLSGDALTGHKNYKFFEKFVFLKEYNRLRAWEKAGASTFAVWTELGLGTI